MTFDELLERAGITKAELARQLEMNKSSVYRWSDATAPGYAKAYLRLLIEYTKVRP